jgi:hypothetical protein
MFINGNVDCLICNFIATLAHAQGVHFILSLSTAVVSLSKPASSRTKTIHDTSTKEG